MTKRIVFTGGGTVGHVTLNLILIPKFLKDGWEVHYIGDKSGIEYQEIKKSGLAITFHGIATGKLRRYFSWQNMTDLFKVTFGICQSLLILMKIKPAVFFSKGGFVAVPPVIAARILNIPVFVHESDLSIGLANKIAYKFATTFYTTFKQGEALSKIKHVGAVTKVTSKDISSLTKELEEIKMHFDPNLKTLLFIGGSGGAKVFNTFISNNPELMESYNVINISGDSSLNELSQHLYRVDYVTKLYQPLIALSDLVITRGGANTLFELLAMRKLHLIIPLGKKASRGDQLENAAYFEKRGYAKQLDEEELTLENLEDMIGSVFSDKEKLEQAMSQSQELQSPDDFYQLLVKDIETYQKRK